jgi:glutaconate CoA-transferase subunit A
MTFEVLDAGIGEFRAPDPNGHRRFIRDHKTRDLVDKRMSAREAVARFVDDGAYVSYDINILNRGPSILFREIIRQRKRDLWVAAKFGGLEVTMFAAAGCVSRVDVGWLEVGAVLNQAINEGKVKFVEWTNGALAYRHLAGALGVPFLPMRYLGGTDSFRQSGAKIVRDPFTGDNIVLVPAINPDVALIHVSQADCYGNARIFGPGIAPRETAMSSKRVVITTEELIDTDEIRRDPGRTTIPHYLVDAVVHAPFGAYPGCMPGAYAADREHLMEYGIAQVQGKLSAYLDKWVHGVTDDQHMLDELVGRDKLDRLCQEETVKEGYHA